jgi:putative transcriptional regulator
MDEFLTRDVDASDGYLDGQLLIAMPTMRDKRFARSVIYMCLHNSSGAMGLIINQRADDISFENLLRELDVLDKADAIKVPDISVLIGGPVETGRGFVLHSGDYESDGSTLKVDTVVRLTNTVDILKAMALGNGPRRALLALGYAGWAPGQLEGEIQANGWLSCPADSDLVFGEDLDLKYDMALSKIGVDPSHLVSYAGRA